MKTNKITLYYGEACNKCEFLKGYLPKRCEDRGIKYNALSWENLAVPPTSIPIMKVEGGEEDEVLDYEGIMNFISTYGK